MLYGLSIFVHAHATVVEVVDSAIAVVSCHTIDLLIMVAAVLETWYLVSYVRVWLWSFYLS